MIDNPPLPPAIEQQLQDLESRHKRHQAMLERHRERKHERRERHRMHWHRLKHPAITLI